LHYYSINRTINSVYSFDSSGWGEPYFSAADTQLPYRSREIIDGTKTVGSLKKNTGIFESRQI
jgi:hypothetical protein